MVGNASEQALQKNVFTLLGILSFHTLVLKVLEAKALELEAFSLSSISQTSWYPILIEYFPILVLGHTIQSS